jgi:formylglycine-generating enzyme required for sulfatase activity
MAGNVAEWTDSSYNSSSYEFASSINPNVTDSTNKNKVVRGGSWKDVAYYLQVSSRDFELDTISRSYIGFRTVQNYMGTDATANKATN